MIPASKPKLLKDPPKSGWAINGRGKRVLMHAYIVMLDGQEIGRISSCLSSYGGATLWHADGLRAAGSFHTRKDAARFVVNHFERLRAVQQDEKERLAV